MVVSGQETAPEKKAPLAVAAWFAESGTIEPGKPLATAICVNITKPWHIYWVNPGEAGVATTFAFTLPDGWRAEAGNPVPVRFKTGGLAGFGYEEKAWFPVTLTPPTEISGSAVSLTAKGKWLACSESACIPGGNEMTLKLAVGKPSETEHAAEIARAFANTPRPAEAPRLSVAEDGGNLILKLEAPDAAWNPAETTAFPATPQVVDPAAEITFVKSGADWTAKVPKNEYAEDPLAELSLVLAGKGIPAPVRITWQAPAK